MLGQIDHYQTSLIRGTRRKTPSVRAGMGPIKSGGWLRRSLLALVFVIVAGASSDTGFAAKVPPIAERMEGASNPKGAVIFIMPRIQDYGIGLLCYERIA